MVNDDPTALMIIRAWIEPGSSDPLRAHIRISADVSAGIERTLTLARPEAVVATVQDWLAEIVSRADTGGTQPDPTVRL